MIPENNVQCCHCEESTAVDFEAIWMNKFISCFVYTRNDSINDICKSEISIKNWNESTFKNIG